MFSSDPDIAEFGIFTDCNVMVQSLQNPMCCKHQTLSAGVVNSDIRVPVIVACVKLFTQGWSPKARSRVNTRTRFFLRHVTPLPLTLLSWLVRQKLVFTTLGPGRWYCNVYCRPMCGNTVYYVCSLAKWLNLVKSMYPCHQE